ncbi:hypothetical protein [Micavibrio aeruginosavorus]|uniref:Uncharacterized protein n=1 Tax=Micavibrio aeruginosavorus (strain ARL-13) TaxID=856793 RepID=G2KLQ7_MICAA|nr:hypothetical protein [Micavibrio aeruginosavorus]AEP08887.1 putative uncharacterized protein gp67 [Micavibrio aeruginosavorus ARL-13]
MSFYKHFTTDKNLESGKGVDLDYGASGIITIHRAGGSNQKYAKVASAKLKPYARQIQAKTADVDVINRVMAEIYAESIIIGWSGVSGPDGKPMKFTKENCVKLLIDLPELFVNIQQAADDFALFRAEQLEEDAKNSAKS